MEVRHRHFRRRREEHLVFLQPVHVFLELRQLRCADHAIATNKEWRADFRVAMFTCVQVEHELDQSALEPRPWTGETNEPAAA